MYDRNLTEASKSALAELCSALTMYKRDFVLAGGWAPYFLTKDHFDHCGSKDIDLVLKPAIMTRYESIRSVIKNLGYEETSNPFRFKKNLISQLDQKEYSINIDFLTEPEAAEQKLREIYRHREKYLNPISRTQSKPSPGEIDGKIEAKPKGFIQSQELKEAFLKMLKENGNETYESKIVASKEELIQLSNKGYECQIVGTNKWLMRKKHN